MEGVVRDGHQAYWQIVGRPTSAISLRVSCL